MHNSSFPRGLRSSTRQTSTLALGVFAAALAFGATKNARAACNEGTSRNCTIDGQAGKQICEDGSWGECLPTGGGGGPPPAPAYDPIGYLDVVQLSSNGTSVTVQGWAADQDSFTTAIQVEVIVDDWNYGPVTANVYRPDVGAAVPAAGSYHGFSTTVPAEPWGSHNVCVRAVNIGSGAPKTLGCQRYAVEGKVTQTWGQTNVTRCVADPIGAIANLPATGPNLGFITSSSSEGLVYSPGSPHWQGVSRLAFGDGQSLVLSRSGSYQFYVARMTDRSFSGAPYGSGVSMFDFTALRMGNNPSIGFDHAGGIQAVGSLLAVPNENHATNGQSLPIEARTQIRFFDMSNPTNPSFLGFLGRNVLVSDEAGAVAMVRLANDRLLMAVGRTESHMLDFYVSEPNDPSAWGYYDTWWQSEAHSTLSDGDASVGDYQGINFVTRCGDGAIFLVGTHQEGDIIGADWADLFRVELDVNNTVLTKVAKRHVDCGSQCNLDAGGGVYVAPDGRLIVYGSEHAADGTVINGQRSVKLREF